jgi:hypothetical protein
VTIVFDPLRSDHPPVGRPAIVELARIESSRMMKRMSIWIGLVLSVVVAVISARSPQNFPEEKYQSLVPLSVYPLAMGAFVAGVRTGNRDRSHRRPPLAEEAPLDGDARALARQASLVVPVAMAMLMMVVIGVASRVEGGFRLGEGRFRTDSAVHSLFELAQPALAIGVVGTAAVAIGRAVRRPGPALVVGMVVLFFALGVFWLWNDRIIYTTAPMQVQPLGFDRRAVVHTPTVILHDVYLIGLATLFVGLSLRASPRRRLVVVGASVAAFAVVAQLVVSPF